MPDTYNLSDVFISYSRKDVDFVRRVFDDLKARDKEVWADFEDIPKAADWWREIEAGINAADTFVFVISPDSVNSEICRREIELAVNSNKRILPVLHRPVNDPDDQQKVHPTISSHNWIFFREQDNYDTAFDTLMSSIETDLTYNRTMSRLLVRAKEWDANQRNNSYLLQGEDLDHAQQWLDASFDKTPSPTDLHADYISASRDYATHRQRQWFTMLAVGFVIAVVFALIAFLQTLQAMSAREEAETAELLAKQAQLVAEVNAARASALALSASAKEALANNDPDLSLILALEALDAHTPAQPQVVNALTDASYSAGTQSVIEPGQVVIYGTAFTRDGRQAIIGMSDGRVCIYDVATSTESTCLTGQGESTAHEDALIAIETDDTGTRLMTVAFDRRVRLWDIAPNSEFFGELTHAWLIDGDVRSAAFSADGQAVLLGFNDGRVGILQVDTGSIRYLGDTHNARVSTMTFNNDGTRALTGAQDGELIYWDLTDDSVQDRFADGHKAEVMSAAIAPDGTIAVTGDRDSGLVVWDLSPRKIKLTMQGHDEAVTDITFDSTGRSVFTSSWDNSLREWDIATGRIVTTFYGHDGGVNTVALSPNNTTIVSGSFDNTIRLWSVDSFIQQREIMTNNTPIESAVYNGEHIITAQEDGSVMVFDAATSAIMSDLSPSDVHEGITLEAESVALDPVNPDFVALYNTGHLALHTIDGATIWETDIDNPADKEQVLFSPDGTMILAVLDDALLLYDAATGDFIRQIPFDDGRDTPRFLSAEFTPDGTQLMVGQNYFSRNLHLIDIDTGEIVREFNGHRDGILSIDFNEDGTLVITGAFDNDVRLWDVEEGETLQLFFGHSDRVVSVSFSPDEQWVISASNDRSVRLWDVTTGFEIYNYTGHTRRVTSVSFSPSGNTIMTASEDSTILIWRLPQEIEGLMDWVVLNRYIRDLSCNERKLYLDPDLDCE